MSVLELRRTTAPKPPARNLLLPSIEEQHDFILRFLGRSNFDGAKSVVDKRYEIELFIAGMAYRESRTLPEHPAYGDIVEECREKFFDMVTRDNPKAL